MKNPFKRLMLVAAMALLGSLPPANAAQIIIHVEALIDGTDLLVIIGNTLQWHHLENAAVGRHLGGNQPTVITTSLDGNLVIDHLPWIPSWPAPPPDWIEYEAFSSIFSNLSPPLPNRPVKVSLKSTSRQAELIQRRPAPANEFSLVIRFSDPVESSAIHQVDIIIEDEKPPFRRGDSSADGAVDVADAVLSLYLLFFGQGEIPCKVAADANDNGTLDISDAILTLTFLFIGGTDIPPPGAMTCGLDPSGDTLDCESPPVCD